MFLLKTSTLFVLLLLVLLSISFLNLNIVNPLEGFYKANFTAGELKKNFILNDFEVNQKSNSVYFVGDIMLGRHVETLMERYGQKYPYQGLNSFNFEKSYLIGNFEASVPVSHVKTKNHTLRFSVDKKYLVNLKSFGFTHLSLANNHSFDFGKSDFLNTKIQLENNGLKSFGQSSFLSSSSIQYIFTKKSKMAIIGINSTYSEPSDFELQNIVSHANDNSDFQIVFIHWGDEYSKNPNNKQKKLAKKLIGGGVDLIIGHHPHVVQSVEIIDGKLVFYSLGNFIFDQYFSKEVMQGIALKLDFGKEKSLIEIIPVTTVNNLSQPSEMTDIEKSTFLKKLSEISAPLLKEEIRQGVIILSENLATL